MHHRKRSRCDVRHANLLGLLLGPASPASPRSRAPHRAAFSAFRPFGFDRFSKSDPGRYAQTAAAPFRCWRAEPTKNRPAISMLWTTVHDPHLPSPTQGFAMQQLAGHWVLSATRPLERSSGPKALEAEMPSPFASSSSALSAAEACGATLEAVLRSRNLKELFGSIQQGRYCDATAHRP